jgi:hypothetical protein
MQNIFPHIRDYMKIRYRPRLLIAERLYAFENTSTDSLGIGTEHS